MEQLESTRISNINVDTSQLPLWRVVFAREVEDAEIPLLFAHSRKLFARRQRLVLLVDASDSHLSARQRKLMVSCMKESENDFRRWVTGAIVVRSALARGTITALQWMMAPPYEQKIFNKLEEAEAWAKQRLKALRLQA